MLAAGVATFRAWLAAGGRIVACVGGMDPMTERRQLAHGAHIVVGTPGRLRDHLERGNLKPQTMRDGQIVIGADGKLSTNIQPPPPKIEPTVNAQPALDGIQSIVDKLNGLQGTADATNAIIRIA